MKENLIKINDFLYEIPKTGKMKVPARIYATENMLADILSDNAPEQAKNVACLPGIVGYSFAMPDMHWGYGFPIGGVAAFDMDDGVISPGGVGYDINCGVRLLRTDLSRKDVQGKITHIVDALFASIPSGVGSTGPVRLSAADEKKVLTEGAHWAVANGYGDREDLDKIEETGRMPGAVPDYVSDHALKRGKAQLGTLGSGNHFVEVGYVEQVFDEKIAARLGLFKNQVTVIVHTGSRGLGHQICDDFIKVMLGAADKYGIYLPDRQLCCAPVRSPEGQRYLGAMAAGVNFAFCNRQLITHWTREAFMRALCAGPKTVNMRVVYEVAHNIAKIEEHKVNGKNKKLCVHRKGATRAFGPGHPAVPESYRDIGQPVLIPGDMGRYSYVLVGTENAMRETFGSTCHGAGRVLSRKKALKRAQGRSLYRELLDKGIYVKASSKATMAEEMPEAYKNVSNVVDAVAGAGISKIVARLKPMGVIKG
ncbi:RtcB family protein [candidate division KSB1 bacterium]|nr:RtcB family protein [candidate division KSB1 bacterium]